MFSVGTKHDQLKKFISITVILTVLCLLLTAVGKNLFAGRGFQAPTMEQAASNLSLAMTGAFFGWLAIIKWAWAWPPFSWLLGVPVLKGTWTGHLESDWQAAGNANPSIPIAFSIRQTLLSLTVTSFTGDREGISYVADLIGNEAAGTLRLAYIYSLREEFRAGEGTQQGAAEGRVTGAASKEFRGEYWTNTKTRGRLILTRRSAQCTASFDEVHAKWPKAGWRKFN